MKNAFQSQIDQLERERVTLKVRISALKDRQFIFLNACGRPPRVLDELRQSLLSERGCKDQVDRTEMMRKVALINEFEARQVG